MNAEQTREFSRFRSYFPPAALLAIVAGMASLAFSERSKPQPEVLQGPVSAPLDLSDENFGVSAYSIIDIKDSRGVGTHLETRAIALETNPFEEMSFEDRVANLKILEPGLLREFVLKQASLLPNSEEIRSKLTGMTREEILKLALEIIELK
ncbi:MAG: hypothetical protein R3A13_03350 [Bdellovibrionota bacterium]